MGIIGQRNGSTAQRDIERLVVLNERATRIEAALSACTDEEKLVTLSMLRGAIYIEATKQGYERQFDGTFRVPEKKARGW